MKKTKKSGYIKKKAHVEDLTCPWILHCSKPRNEETWRVKKFIDEHHCLQTRDVKKCTATFLSKEIEHSIKPNPKIPLAALKDQLQKKYELGVSRQKVFRAKQMAQERVIGDYTKQYANLKQYVLEFKEKNPDTTIKIEVERNSNVVDSNTRQFKRIYVC